MADSSDDILEKLDSVSEKISDLKLLMTKEIAQLWGAVGKQEVRSVSLTRFVYWQAGIVFMLLAGQWAAIVGVFQALP